MLPDTSIRTDAECNPTIEEMGTDFACDVVAAERRLLAGSWLNPRRLHEAALRHELNVEDFAHRGHGFVAEYLCLAVEHGVENQISIPHCCRMAAQIGVPLGRWYLFDYVYFRYVDEFNTNPTDWIDELTQIVVSYGKRRQRAQGHLTEVARLLAGDPTDPNSLLATTPKVRLAKRLQRRRKHCA